MGTSLSSFLSKQTQEVVENHTIADYKKRYKKVKRLGAGAAGTAWLVRDKQGGKKLYVSKKVILDGKNEKERKQCMNEVNFIKNLQNPNIVGYVDSYHSDNTLVIVMEYCEAGDLLFVIEKHKKKGTYIQERDIFNWFV